MNFTPRSQKIIKQAEIKAFQLNQNLVTADHLFLALLEEPRNQALELIQEINVDFEKIKSDVTKLLTNNSKLNIQIKVDYDSSFNACLKNSEKIAKDLGQGYITPEHIFLAIVEDKKSTAYFVMNKLKINLEEISAVVKETFHVTSSEQIAKEGEAVAAGNVGKDDDENVSSILEKFGTNLIKKAATGNLSPTIGREQEIDRIITILARKTKNNPILVGDAGTGKSNLAYGLAQKIYDEAVPSCIKNKIIYELNLTLLLANTKYRGQFENRIKRVIDEVRDSQGKIIVFIDEIHTIIGAGSSEGTLDASNILKPALANGEFSCIGATTLKEYRKYFEKDSALQRRFQPVFLNEPNEEETFEIARFAKIPYEKFHNVKFEDDLLRKSIALAQRYITERRFPDKIIDIIDESSAFAKINYISKKTAKLANKLQELYLKGQEAEENQRYEDLNVLHGEIQEVIVKLEESMKKEEEFTKKVTFEDVVSVISKWTNIEPKNIQSDNKDIIKNIDVEISKHIFGQSEAIKKVSEVIKKSRTPFRNFNRPLASFMFCGPSGVGKTLLAKKIAQIIFGSEEKIISIDMTNYSEKGSNAKLIGAPAGYIGYEDSKKFDEIRNKPYSIVLFDEIDKAHPEIYTLLMSILENGQIIDNSGREISFRNCIIIMTSNKGFSLTKPLGFSNESSSLELREQLNKTFPVEFLNRIDSLIPFENLSEQDYKNIAIYEIKKLQQELAKSNFSLDWTPKVIDWIVNQKSDSENGRKIREIIEKQIKTSLVEKWYSNNNLIGAALNISKNQLFVSAVSHQDRK